MNKNSDIFDMVTIFLSSKSTNVEFEYSDNWGATIIFRMILEAKLTVPKRIRRAIFNKLL